MGKINKPPCSRTAFATFSEESLHEKQSILEYFVLQRITCARQQTLLSTAGWLKRQRHSGDYDDNGNMKIAIMMAILMMMITAINV